MEVGCPVPEPMTAKLTIVSLLLFTVSAVSSGWHWLVAQAAPGTVTDFVPDVANLGCLGAVIWFFYYTNSTHIPKLLESAREERNQSRKEFLDELREHREHLHQMSVSLANLTESTASLLNRPK